MGKRNLPEEVKEKKNGILYIVSTPIGNDEDISLRAIKVLKNCDLVVCEEAKPAFKLLRNNNLSCDIVELNEQNEEQKTQEIIFMLEEGKKLALISDCGTPVFADPGFQLVKTAIHRNYQVEVIPGASSLMAAIVKSGFPIKTFIYAGFLSRDHEERMSQLKNLREERRTIVLLEAPYRLMAVLEAAAKLMPNRRAYIGCNLTMHFETNHYGTFSELYDKFEELKFKGEFVIVFEGNFFHENKERDFKSKSRFGERNKRDYKPGRSFSRDRDSGRSRGPRRDRDSGGDKSQRDFRGSRDRDSRGERGPKDRPPRDRDYGTDRGARDRSSSSRGFGDRDFKGRSSERRDSKGDKGTRGIDSRDRSPRDRYSKSKGTKGKNFSGGRRSRD
ncbi:MAG: 16S rRNA (cytidine(1402)-2'-O)-methyltransferase [Ignavibacteriae bacterium]|nr:16S rRNA (cytidine(1402)-2'-O)-methyltransferase [Ignavibacteriota bacterium]